MTTESLQHAPFAQTYAASPAPAAAALVEGVVRTVAPVWLIDIGDGDCSAVPAASCLVRPEPGDKVLLCRVGADRGYILAVLERAAAATPVTVSAPDGLTFEADRGDVSVRAGGAVTLVGTEATTIATAQLTVRAATATMIAEEALADAERLTARTGRLTLVAERVDQMVDHLTARFNHVLRLVTGVDRTQATTIAHEAREELSLRGQRAFISAREDVRIDGERIHLA